MKHRSLIRGIPAIAALVVLACGCASGSGEPRRDDGALFLNVVEREDLGAEWACASPGFCIEDYKEFLRIAASHSNPVPASEIWKRLREIDSGNVPTIPGPLSADTLRDAVTDSLNIRFLLDGIDARLLVVTTIGKTETADYTQYRLLLEDPWVGVFEGLLLVPWGRGPFPAVVAIHGHNDTAEVFRDKYHGKEYPGRGYAILMLTMRAMGSGLEALVEHAISRELLLDGFTLMGLRVYETFLGLKYLRYLPAVARERIGLIGHSGGSSTGNLTVRLDPGVAAYVSDHTVDYAEWVPFFHVYHCETVPELYPYSLLINDFETGSVPVKTVPYRYTGRMGEIFDFFDHGNHAGPAVVSRSQLGRLACRVHV